MTARRNQALLDRVSTSLSTDLDARRMRDLTHSAIHEAGHVVAFSVLGSGMTLSVTLSDDEAITTPNYSYGRGLPGPKPDRLKAKLIVYAAGAAAARRHDPQSDGGGSADDEMINQAAAELHGCLASQDRLEREIAKARRRAERLVALYWPQIVATAKRLLDNHIALEAIQRRTARQFD